MTIAERRKTHREALLDLLSDHMLHDMDECLKAGGFRYGGRLHELRRAGYAIETVRLVDDLFAYRLLPPEPKQLALMS